MQINTKIFKTQIEIVNDKQIIFKGDKVDGNQASLLEKLGIRPFSYKMMVKNVYDNGVSHRHTWKLASSDTNGILSGDTAVTFLRTK